MFQYTQAAYIFNLSPILDDQVMPVGSIFESWVYMIWRVLHRPLFTPNHGIHSAMLQRSFRPHVAALKGIWALNQYYQLIQVKKVLKNNYIVRQYKLRMRLAMRQNVKIHSISIMKNKIIWKKWNRKQRLLLVMSRNDNDSEYVRL